jgi:antibiotic biosynthesis monooxygenase (ABM) superfamily enzyme
MKSASNAAQPSTAGVTIVTQTRVAQDKAEAFASWQRDVSAIVAAQPGFIEQTILPPNPPVQLDWVILQRFARTENAVAWLRSDERARLVAQAQPLLVGQDDVHLLNEKETGVLPAPASAVISTRIRPGQENAYREWERRIAAAQARAPGFQGYRFEPPVAGVQDDWLAILRFDSEANLQAWLASSERKKLLEEAGAFTEEYHARIVRTGFDQWFQVGNPEVPSAPAWKQNMVVLMILFPVVVLFNLLVQTPLLIQHWKFPPLIALFIGNAVSVTLLSLIVPWASRRLDWWLRASGNEPKIELSGAALVVGIYALCLLVFWQTA